MQVNRQKTAVKKNITIFYVAALFTFFEKLFAICKFFTVMCLDIWFSNLLYFIWSLIHSIDIFFFAGRKFVDLVVIFNKERDLYKIAKTVFAWNI